MLGLVLRSEIFEVDKLGENFAQRPASITMYLGDYPGNQMSLVLIILG
jgi:hypothetical protein